MLDLHNIDEVSDGEIEEDNSVTDNSKVSSNPTSSSREKLGNFINSKIFICFSMALVVIDCVIVTAGLWFDVAVHKITYKPFEKMLHYTGLVILCVFIIEIILRLYTMRLLFFKHKMEVFDAFIVSVSLFLDIRFGDTQATDGTELIIILRLWRVFRVINGIIKSAKRDAYKQIKIHRRITMSFEHALAKCQRKCAIQMIEIERLHRLLEFHGIDYDVTGTAV